MFTKPSFTYFEITSHPNTFCKNNPRFFCNYKNTLFTYTLNFRKLHINTHKLYTNIYFTLTKYLPSITNTRTVTIAFPSKKNLVPRFRNRRIWMINFGGWLGRSLGNYAEDKIRFPMLLLLLCDDPTES
jgi:hypothetical protein